MVEHEARDWEQLEQALAEGVLRGLQLLAGLVQLLPALLQRHPGPAQQAGHLLRVLLLAGLLQQPAGLARRPGSEANQILGRLLPLLRKASSDRQQESLHPQQGGACSTCALAQPCQLLLLRLRGLLCGLLLQQLGAGHAKKQPQTQRHWAVSWMRQTARKCELRLFSPMNVCNGSLCQNVTPML